MVKQTFIDTNTQQWLELEQLPGTQILPLAEPVPQGSIHKLRIFAGTVIPVHVHRSTSLDTPSKSKIWVGRKGRT